MPEYNAEISAGSLMPLESKCEGLEELLSGYPIKRGELEQFFCSLVGLDLSDNKTS